MKEWKEEEEAVWPWWRICIREWAWGYDTGGEAFIRLNRSTLMMKS